MTEIWFVLSTIVTVTGILFAFYLGARKGEEKIINTKSEPERMDIPNEPTEEEYLKSIKAWMPDGEANEEAEN